MKRDLRIEDPLGQGSRVTVKPAHHSGDANDREDRRKETGNDDTASTSQEQCCGRYRNETPEPRDLPNGSSKDVCSGCCTHPRNRSDGAPSTKGLLAQPEAE